jgi:hypothetical protein
MRKLAYDDPVESFFWRTPFGIASISYYLLMALVGLLIPDDIFKANPWAQDFSDLIASTVPQIDRITALNIKPDVNRFYFSVLWAGSPALFVAVIFFFVTRPFDPEEWRQSGAPAYQSFLFLIASGLMFGWWPQTLQWVTSELRLTHLLFESPVNALFTQVMLVSGPCVMLAVTPFAFAAWYRKPKPSAHFL